jgi:hypothetical protein
VTTINSLEQIKPNQIHRRQQQALMRLQLRVTGEVHRQYRQFFDWLAARVNQAANGDGTVDILQIMAGFGAIETRWRRTINGLAAMLDKAREQAASLPFGALVVYHNSQFRYDAGPVNEALSQLDRTIIVQNWERRRQRILQATRERVYSDGFALSQRIWRLESDGLAAIRSTLMTALTEQTNAASLARSLESLLGAGANCPRWTRSRLYGQTVAERASSTEGLITGSECESQGLAYNALRLARNEIQIAHHAANDEILRAFPGAVGEKVRLSPAHAEIDICDELASGGPYQSGEIILPAHVQCMCYKEAVLMPPDEFSRNVRGWLSGENTFLNDYQEYLGIPPAQQLEWVLPIAETLIAWLAVDMAVHAALLGVEN